MTGALIILAVTVAVGLLLWFTHRPECQSDGKEAASSAAAPDDGEACCGLHAVCEKGLTSSGKPVYFDDEELDRFAGRQPDDYTPDEEDEFREVLYTLLPSDVYPWGVSLTQRDIALPYVLRDEWLMMVNETTQPKN